MQTAEEDAEKRQELLLDVFQPLADGYAEAMLTQCPWE